LNFQHPARSRPTAISLCVASRRARAFLEIFVNCDPRWALSQELEAKQTLLDQLCALAAEDPDFLTDLIDGETNLLELTAALDASIIDDEILADGAKAALDKLQADAHPHGREPQGHRRRPEDIPARWLLKPTSILCEAMLRPGMRFVPISAEQQATLMLHKTRELLVKQRAMSVNALRSHLFRIRYYHRQGNRRIDELLKLAEVHTTLPDAAKTAVKALTAILEVIEKGIGDLEGRIADAMREAI
jgi:hypothetical protein